MKTLNLGWYLASIALSATLCISACRKVATEEITPQHESKKLSSVQTTLDTVRIDPANPYGVTLESVINNGNGTYSWTWSAHNPNPGDGTNGTYPDLDHLDFSLGHYLAIDNLISTDVSTDGLTWTTVRPQYTVDSSQTCSPDTLLQVNLGTRLDTKSYYRITINSNNNTEADLTGVYVSGGGRCNTYQYTGFGSPIDIIVVDNSCAQPVSYYFAKKYIWRSNVVIGGYTYTQSEAKAIYNTPDKKAIADSKFCFLQLIPIKLGATVYSTAPIWDDVARVENYLSQLNKLSPKNLPTGNPEARAAAERLKVWIDSHRCTN